MPAADPLAPASAEPETDPMRFERLRRALMALAAWLELVDRRLEEVGHD